MWDPIIVPGLLSVPSSKFYSQNFMLDISIQQRIVYFFIIRGTETRPGEMFTDSKRVSALYKYQGLQAVY